MSGNELVTLQLGSYANYVGTHFWNVQDEHLGYTEREDWAELASCVDHSTLFSIKEDRTGKLLYRPRALWIDLHGSLGGVRFGSSPSEAATGAPAVTTWGGPSELHAAQQVDPSRFVSALLKGAELDDDADEEALESYQAELEDAASALDDSRNQTVSWTDFLKAELPRSCVTILPRLWGGTDSVHAGGTGGGSGDSSGGVGSIFCGVAAALDDAGPAGREAREELDDRVRALVEECDCFQGFQVLAEDVGSFGSLTHRLMQDLREDFGREALMFSLRQPMTGTPPAPGSSIARVQSANECLATALLPGVSSLYVPLCVPTDAAALPHLQYRLDSMFHTSAILAAAIDSVTQPARLPATPMITSLGAATGSANVHSLVRLLTGRGGANLASTSMYLPCPMVPADMQVHQQQAAHAEGSPAGYTPLPRGDADSANGVPPLAHEHCLLTSTTRMASLAPGVAADADAAASAGEGNGGARLPLPCLAQSLVVRGARGADGPVSTSRAAGVLDAALLATAQLARPAVSHRCVCPMPLPLPLPFPASVFGPTVECDGSVFETRAAADAARALRAATAAAGEQGAGVGGGAGGRAAAAAAAAAAASAAHAGGSLSAVPVLTRLASTAAFGPVLERACATWRSLRRSAPGSALLASWAYDGAEAEEVEETLQSLAGAYAECDDGL